MKAYFVVSFALVGVMGVLLAVNAAQQTAEWPLPVRLLIVGLFGLVALLGAGMAVVASVSRYRRP